MIEPEQIIRCRMADSVYRAGRCWLIEGHPMDHLSIMDGEEIRYNNDGAVPFVPPKETERCRRCGHRRDAHIRFWRNGPCHSWDTSRSRIRPCTCPAYVPPKGEP